MTEFKQFNTEIFVMEKVSKNNNCDFDKLTLEKCTPKDPPVERPDICLAMLKQGVRGMNIEKLQVCR